MILAIVICVITDIIITVPVVPLYFAATELFSGADTGGISASNLPIYIASVVLLLVIIAVSAFVKHIFLMKLSDIPQISAPAGASAPDEDPRTRADALLSVFREEKYQKYSAEQWNALIISSFISSAIIVCTLFIFDIRLALAAVWPLPFSLILYLLCSKVKSSNPLYRKDRVQLDAMVCEYLHICDELKRNNAEEWYLKRLEKNISYAEFSAFRYNRSTILFSSLAGLLPQMALASTALAGAAFITSGTLSPELFILALLISSRAYIPLITALDSIKF